MTLAILLIITHFFFDWILQSRQVANNKSKNFGVCLDHGTVTGAGVIITLSICSIFYLNVKHWWLISLVGIANAVAHTIQDWFIWRIYKKYHNPNVEFQNDYWFYSTIAIDQTLHIVLMLWLVSLIIN